MFRAKDREKCLKLFQKYYAGRKFHDALYRDAIQRYLRPGQHLLDAGCGRHMKFCKEFSRVARVAGIDLESALETRNQRAPFGVCGDLSQLPFTSDYFDMVISRSVVEHLENPPQVFRELYRVLKPGGKLVMVTPNKYDYVSLIAAITPYRLHQVLVSKIFQISESDVFPTLYRANTPSSMQRTLSSAGFIERELETISHYPAYLMFSPTLFRLGMIYERLTSLTVFRLLRSSILCVYEKESGFGIGSSVTRAHESERVKSAPAEVS